MIAAVILAAGESTRMGSPKALLPIEGKNFIERIVEELRRSRVGKIFVVLGHDAEEMRRQVEHLPVTLLINPDYRVGQLSSLQVAVRRLLADEECSAMVVHLVDHPYITAVVVDRLIAAFEAGATLIAVPRYRGKRGHPVLFARSLFGELLNAPADQGAKAVVHAHEAETLVIDTDDEGITLDIDTPELYRRHVRE